MFNEKNTEWTKDMGDLQVWQSPKYIVARDKAIALIESNKYDLNESDFWILMNLNGKRDKMVYTGLIISHNGCLKINEKLDSRFNPSCVSVDTDGFGKSLVYTYCNPEQGLYEVGEASANNCKNAYPYAMAFKRCFDRVVLKLSKLAFAGIYSDAEADEFRDPLNAPEAKPLTGKAKLLQDIGVLRNKRQIKPEALDKSCIREYGKKLDELDEGELKSVLAKMNESA